MTHESNNYGDLVHALVIAKEMAQLGVTCLPVDKFHYREPHDTNPKDAVVPSMCGWIRVGLAA